LPQPQPNLFAPISIKGSIEAATHLLKDTFAYYAAICALVIVVIFPLLLLHDGSEAVDFSAKGLTQQPSSC